MRIDYDNLAADSERLEKLLHFAQLSERCDSNVEDTFLLANSLRNSKQMQACVERLKLEPRASELINFRPLLPRRHPDELAAFEQGTLGQIYYEIIKREALSYDYAPSPEYFNNLELEADYVNYVVFSTHDFYHIVSGFALDIFGEMGARSLLVAQCGYPPMALTDVVNLLSSWLSNDICPSGSTEVDDHLSQVYLLEVMALGIRMAKGCVPLFGVDWDALLPLPLDTVRQRLKIIPVTEGRYSWHSQHTFSLPTNVANDHSNSHPSSS